MTEEELRIFELKTKELRRRNLLVLDEKSKNLIANMKKQYQEHLANQSKSAKVATVFYSGS